MSDQPNPTPTVQMPDLPGMPALEWVTGMQEQLREDADLGADRLSEYRLQQEAYDGELVPSMTDRQRKYLEAHGVGFTENFHETVVDVHADLSQLEAVQFPGRDALTEWANGPVWAHSNLDAVQARAGHSQLLKGDAFLMVTFDQDAGLPVFHFERPDQMKVVGDDEGTLYIVKVWSTARPSPTNPRGRPIRRLNRYFPDRVEKWFTLASNDSGDAHWLPHLDADDLYDAEFQPVGDDLEPLEDAEPVLVEAATWPVDWTTEDGEPIGINVFHLKHKALDGTYGRSIGRGWMPFQAQIDKQLLDLFQVMDTQGWKQRHAAGIESTDDLTVATGEWVSTRNENARFGEFEAEDPRPLLDAIEATLRRGAAKVRVPLHMLMTSGTLPSGESLKSAESPGVRTARARNIFSGPVIVDAFKMAVRLTEVFGEIPDEETADEDAADDAGLADLVVIPVWADPQSRNEKSEAETFEAYNRLGVSRRTLLTRLGFDPDEEEENRAEEAEEARALFDSGADETQPLVDDEDAEGDPRDGGGRDVSDEA